MTRYARYAWAVLAANLAVILWGAFVRATGSGAGCGSHWPLCNGEVVPRAPAIATLIEFTHRATSGIALLLVAGLVVAAWRSYPRGHRVRLGAALSGVFMLTEALIGAGLVLLEYVADDRRLARGVWVAAHLANTYFLVAALALTAWWASGGPALRLKGRGRRLGFPLGALAAMLFLGVSGAVTALGDTLFPAATLAEAETLTFSGTAHLFVRLRVWHPALAVVVGALVLTAAAAAAERGESSRRLALGFAGLYAFQIGLGLINVWLLAPVGVQILHLLVSDLLWIDLVLLVAAMLADLPSAAREPATALHADVALPRR